MATRVSAGRRSNHRRELARPVAVVDQGVVGQARAVNRPAAVLGRETMAGFSVAALWAIGLPTTSHVAAFRNSSAEDGAAWPVRQPVITHLAHPGAALDQVPRWPQEGLPRARSARIRVERVGQHRSPAGRRPKTLLATRNSVSASLPVRRPIWLSSKTPSARSSVPRSGGCRRVADQSGAAEPRYLHGSPPGPVPEHPDGSLPSANCRRRQHRRADACDPSAYAAITATSRPGRCRADQHGVAVPGEAGRVGVPRPPARRLPR